MNRRLVFAGFSLAMFLSTSAALAAVDPAVLKARQKFFGIDNVDEFGPVAAVAMGLALRKVGDR